MTPPEDGFPSGNDRQLDQPGVGLTLVVRHVARLAAQHPHTGGERMVGSITHRVHDALVGQRPTVDARNLAMENGCVGREGASEPSARQRVRRAMPRSGTRSQPGRTRGVPRGRADR